MIPRRPNTLVELLLSRADADGDARDAIRYLKDGVVEARVTGADLLRRAQRVAGALQSHGVKAGDRVLLMMVAQSDFVDAFFGCVWLGAVPVPLFPPVFTTKLDDFLARFSAIAANADARALAVSVELAEPAQALASSVGGGLLVLGPDAWRGDASQTQPLRQAPQTQPDALAFLQYTSGSTGAPKGVALTHANVLANVEMIGKATGFGPHDVGVSWLPLYHDMGLIGGLLSTLRWGAVLLSMSPIAFAKRPQSWLETISAHGGTLSPAPNFAFRRCLKLSDDDVRGLDLSTWRVAFNGAEPVDAPTLEKFATRFAPHGFKRSTLYPVYGLAEHTLAVTFPVLGAQPVSETVHREHVAQGRAEPVAAHHPAALTFVAVGVPLQGVTLSIRDGEGAARAEGEIGELWVQSPSVMQGYFNNPEATATAIVDGWLRTGDLAYLRGGQLFIAGRAKDLIIRAGRNYYPQDLETAAAEVPGIRAGRVAAFSLPVDGEEQVCVVAEIDGSVPPDGRLASSVSERIATRVGFRPERVVLCGKGELPLTSSGKVQRKETRARIERGELNQGG